MRAGQLRHRVDITANSPSANDYGEKVDNWITQDTVWARVSPLSGRELERAQQVNAETSHSVVMRYWAGLTTDHRLTHKGRTLEILAIVNRDDRDIELQLMCREAV